MAHKNCCIVSLTVFLLLLYVNGVNNQLLEPQLVWAPGHGRWWVINVKRRACAGSRQQAASKLPLKLVIHADRLRQSNTRRQLSWTAGVGNSASDADGDADCKLLLLGCCWALWSWLVSDGSTAAAVAIVAALLF